MNRREFVAGAVAGECGSAQAPDYHRYRMHYTGGIQSPAHPDSVSSVLCSLCRDLYLLLLLAAYDLWSSRKIHRATFWGSAFLIFMGQMSRFIGPTASWHAFAHWVQSWGI